MKKIFDNKEGKNMSRIEDLKNQNCQDVWPKLYYYIASELIAQYEQDGERALRCGIRRYGKDRGQHLRALHIEKGYPINMYSLFMAYDLPDDPRFRRRSIKLNPSERLSETLVCPIADLWLNYDGRAVGRIYCEEYHHAMFGAYAEGSQTNLGQTLTQEGDDHCRFSVYYRAANAVTAYQDTEADFSEFREMPYRVGIEMIVTRLLNDLYISAAEILGKSQAIDVFSEALILLAKDVAAQYHNFAESIDEKIDIEWLDKEFPLPLHQSAPCGYFLEFQDQTPWQLFKTSFEPLFLQELGL